MEFKGDGIKAKKSEVTKLAKYKQNCVIYFLRPCEVGLREPSLSAACGRISDGEGLCRNRSYANGSAAVRHCFKRRGKSEIPRRFFNRSKIILTCLKQLKLGFFCVVGLEIQKYSFDLSPRKTNNFILILVGTILVAVFLRACEAQTQ